jgi:uncharacterized membrane protein YdbT with pleckstrin-like domain
MTKYKSKIGTEILIPLILLFIALVFITKDGYSIWWVFAVAPVVLFIVYLFRNTFYTIKDSTLEVKSGFLVNLSIEVNSITKIKETNNILSAPALSLDRLEVSYGTGNKVLISPEEKSKFIEHLRSLNPDIKVLLKK